MPDRPLRILQILRAPVGGLFRHVRDLTSELAKRGHEVGIVVDSLRSDGLSAQRLEALKEHARLGIHSMPMPRVIGRGDIVTPFKVRELARRLDVSVLHGHGAKGGLFARLGRAGVGGRVALYTPHGGVLNYKPGSGSARLFRTIERQILPFTDAIIFESAFAERAFEQQIGMGSVFHRVVHNGLAAAEFEPVPLSPDARDFVFIGEFRAVKGIDTLLRALAQLTGPNGRPATAILAGDGPDRPMIEALIAELGMKDRTTLPGAQPARAMLALGRCLVVPSLAESLPYVVLEGSAGGRPVIATDVGGINEIYGPTAGSLIPAGDVESLRRAMQAVLDDPQAAQAEMAERYAFIRDRFSIETMTDSIEGLYGQVLAKRNS